MSTIESIPGYADAGRKRAERSASKEAGLVSVRLSMTVAEKAALKSKADREGWAAVFSDASRRAAVEGGESIDLISILERRSFGRVPKDNTKKVATKTSIKAQSEGKKERENEDVQGQELFWDEFGSDGLKDKTK